MLRSPSGPGSTAGITIYGWSPIVAIPITGMTCGTPASRSHVEASRTNDSRAALSKKYRRWNVFSATRAGGSAVSAASPSQSQIRIWPIPPVSTSQTR